MTRFFSDLKTAFAEIFFLPEIAKTGILFGYFALFLCLERYARPLFLATFFGSVLRVGFVATEADFFFFEWDVAAFFGGNLPFICLPFLLRLDRSRGK